MNKVKEIFNRLKPSHKKAVVLGSIFLVFIAIALLTRFFWGPDTTRPFVSVDKGKKEIRLDPQLLEKSNYIESSKQISSMGKTIEDMKKQFELLQESRLKNSSSIAAPQEITKSEQTPRQAGAIIKNNNLAPAPPRGVPGGGMPPLPPPPPSAAGPIKAPVERDELYGGISSFASREVSIKKDEDVKKKKMTIFLPPSFMAATLLSGLDAPTVEGGKSHPVPALLRINDLAFLPNSVKANLKGCFVIAEGSGNLADERAHLRLVSLSCLSKKGKSVINQSIKGFVVDNDGKIGVRGVVVSKMGSMIARTIIAGFLQGFGDAFNQSALTSSISALGQTQTIDPDKLWRAGLGKGVSTSAGEVAKFYLDLARQTLPVIEIGSARPLTLVVSDGVELEVKEISSSNKLEEEPIP